MIPTAARSQVQDLMSPQRTLGVITNNQNDVFQRNVISGIRDVASQHGYNVIIDSIAEDSANPEPVSLDPASLDGVLIIANVLSDDRLRQLHHSGTPLTLISHQVPDTPIPAVITDNMQGMEVLMRHLVQECERRRIVFIRGDMNQTDGVERDAAFRRELMRYNLSIPNEFFLEGDFIPAQAGERMRSLLEQRRDFDAVLAADYLMAIAAMNVLREADLRVPQDVVVVGFGDGIEAAQTGLTTVAADVVEQGRRGTRQLIGQINGLRIRGVTVLNTSLVRRDTTRP
jgi:LacI family transcriptional regulator